MRGLIYFFIMLSQLSVKIFIEQQKPTMLSN